MSALAAAVRYRTLIDRLGAIVWEAIPGRVPGEASFLFVSEATESLLGYPADSWIADRRFWFEMVEPEDRALVNTEIVGAVLGRRGADFEYRARAADGRVLWLRNIVQFTEPDDERPGEVRLTGVLVDITGRKAAEARLLRLQELTDALSSTLTPREVAAVVAEEGRDAVGAVAAAVFLRVGDELELAGYDGHAELGPADFCRIPVDSDTPAAEAVRTGSEILLDAAALVARYPGAAGFRRLAGEGQLVALPLVAADRVLGSIALRLADDQPVLTEDRVVLDVLERATVSALLRAEQAAAERDSRAVLNAIITTAPEGFALFDTSLRYVRVNDALAAINGVPAAEHIGRTLSEVVPGVPDSGSGDPLRRVLATGEPVVDLEVTGTTAGRPDEQRTWLVSYYPVRGATEEISWLGSFVVDITERKRAEERARLLSELGVILDAVVSVSARMGGLVDALVPAVCTYADITLHAEEGGLEWVASRGLQDPALTVPLLVRGRDLGVLSMTFARPEPDAEDRAFAAEVARRAALAIDNARLFEAERVARERTGRQYAVAAALAEALTAADVARATLEEVVVAVGAEHGTLWLLDDEGTGIDAIGWLGFSNEEMAGSTHADLDESRPVTDTVRSRKRLWLASPEEIAAAYPAMSPGMHARGMHSIAVFPLMTPGRTVGGLLLSCTRARALTEEDLELGTALAAQAAQALERARLFEAERRVSVTLQRSLLPATLPEVAGAEIDLRYLPAAGLEAGGDFYEAVSLADGSLLVAVGDVVGRGATAAAAMGQLRSALRAFALAGEEPAGILRGLSGFAETVAEAMAATAVVAKLDPATGRLRFACAGHPWPLLVRAAGTGEFLLEGRSVPLGCMPDPGYTEATVELGPGDTLLLYTDGLTERRGQDLDEILERVRAAAAAAAGAPLDELLDDTVGSVGDAPADDVALVALRFTGAAAVERLVFDAGTDQVPIARHAIRDWLARVGVDGPADTDLLLASGEAIANAVEHSGTDRIEVELAPPIGGAVGIVVRDYGRWKDPIVSPNRGRGFGLMRALVDDCAVERSPAGTTVRLRYACETDDPLATEIPASRACTVAVDSGEARLSGDLDLACAEAVREQLAGAEVDTVDLSGVTHLDSTGARMLFELPGRPAFLAPPESPSRRTLELSGLAGVMDVRDA
ncbi:MAG: SpoIIE family protein phosphatase [Solirubrobacteraceae bacterium]